VIPELAETDGAGTPTVSGKSVVVLDYGLGNIRSAERALARTGAQVSVSVDREAAIRADGLIVPGVGAFAACMQGLLSIDGDKIIAERLAAGKPVLGICVGAQILFAEGAEVYALYPASTDTGACRTDHGSGRGHCVATVLSSPRIP